jgi:hypothetical protein
MPNGAYGPINFVGLVLSPGQILWTWENNAPPDYPYHFIEFWENKAGGGYGSIPFAILPGNTEFYERSGLDPNTLYCCKVIGGWIEPPGYSDWSNEDCKTTFAELEDPTELIASVFSNFIELTWKDNASEEDNYCIERKLHSGSWLADHGSEIATVSKNMEFFRDETVVAGTEYDYRVCARQGEEPPYEYSDDYTNVVTVTANSLPDKVIGLQITELSDEQLRLTWDAVEVDTYDVTGYRIEKSPDGEEETFEEIAVVDSDVLKYLVRNLTPDTPYWFRVRAYNGVGNGGFSDYVWDTTLPQYQQTDFEAFVRDPNIEPVYIAEINLKMNVSGFSLVSGREHTYKLAANERGIKIDGVREDGGDYAEVTPEGSEEEAVVDGGLESWITSTDMTNWVEFGANPPVSILSREDVEIHGGLYSCKLYTKTQGEYIGFYQDITLTPDGRYKITVWYKRPVAANSALRLYVTTSPANNIYLQADGTWSASTYFFPLDVTDAWTKFEFEFDAHPDYSTFRIRLYKDQSSGGESSFYVDDISVSGGLDFVSKVEDTPSSFYFDSSNQMLYVHTSDDADPDTHFMEVAFTHLIPNRDFIYADSLCTLPPWLTLKNIPGTSQEINEVHEGTYKMSSGQISFVNAFSEGEFYFDKRFAVFTWIGAKLGIYMGRESYSSLSQFKKFFTAIVSDVSINDKQITLSIRDVTKDLDRDLVLSRYSKVALPGHNDYPALAEDDVDKEILKGWGCITGIVPMPVDTTRNKYNFLDGRSKEVIQVTIETNGVIVEKTKGTDFFVDYQRSIITFVSTLTIAENDVIRVSFIGGVNSANESIVTGAEIFKKIMNGEAGLPTEKLNTDWIYETKYANTKSLTVFILKDMPFNEINRNLEHSTEAYVLQDGEGRIGLRPLQVSVRSNAKYIWNFQSKGHSHRRTKDNIYWKVKVYYGENPQSQEAQSFKEAQDDEIKWKYGVENGLEIYAYYSDSGSALTLAESILALLNKPYIEDELPAILFDVFPGDLIKFSRDRFFNEDGVANELTLRILKIGKTPQSGKTSLRMERVVEV